MSISIACASCGKQYKLDDRFAGKRVKCNRCGSTFSVPAETAAPPPPAPAPVPAPIEFEAAAPAATAASGYDAGSSEAEHSEFTSHESTQQDTPDHGSTEHENAEHETSGHAPDQGNETSDFDAAAGDPFGESSDAGASVAPTAEPQHEEFDAAPAREPERRSEPAVTTRFPVSQAPPPQDRLRAAAISAAARADAEASAGSASRGLSDVMAGLLYVIGVAIAFFGAWQVVSAELYGRRFDRSGWDASSLGYAQRLLMRGGICVVAGLLVLIFAAVVHLHGAIKRSRPAGR